MTATRRWSGLLAAGMVAAATGCRDGGAPGGTTPTTGVAPGLATIDVASPSVATIDVAAVITGSLAATPVGAPLAAGDAADSQVAARAFLPGECSIEAAEALTSYTVPPDEGPAELPAGTYAPTSVMRNRGVEWWSIERDGGLVWVRAESPGISAPPACFIGASVAALTSFDALVGVTWAWQRYADPYAAFQVETPARYTLVFAADGTADIVADCNTAVASYIADSRSLRLTMNQRSDTVCAEGSRSGEFIERLGAASAYHVEGDVLQIFLPFENGVLTLTPATAGPELP